MKVLEVIKITMELLFQRVQSTESLHPHFFVF